MKSAVLIKQVLEAPTIHGEPGGAGTVGSDSQRVTNPFDLFAIEEALQTREKQGGEVVAITLGPDTAVEVLRDALARGANQVVHLKDAAFADLDAPGAAKVLAGAVKKLGDVDLVFVGKQTIDTNTSLTGPMVARYLGITLLTEVFKVLEIDAAGRRITVERLLEGGRQVVKGRLPAVIAVTKDINQPRYPSLLGIRKASKAPVTVWGAADLDVAARATTRVAGRAVPPARPEGELFEGETEELAAKLADKLAELKFI